MTNQELWKHDELGNISEKVKRKVKKHPKGLTEEQIKKLIEEDK